MKARIAGVLRRLADRLDHRPRFRITLAGQAVTVTTDDPVSSAEFDKMAELYEAFVKARRRPPATTTNLWTDVEDGRNG